MITKGRHKVADINIMEAKCATSLSQTIDPSPRRPPRDLSVDSKRATPPQKPPVPPPPRKDWRAEILRARAARTHDQKISKLETTKANSERTLAALDAELQALNNSTSQPASAPTPTQARAYAPTLPQPPTWKPESKDANSTAELIYSITDTELKQRVLEGTI